MEELTISRLLFFVKQSAVVAVDAGIEDELAWRERLHQATVLSIDNSNVWIEAFCTLLLLPVLVLSMFNVENLHVYVVTHTLAMGGATTKFWEARCESI